MNTISNIYSYKSVNLFLKKGVLPLENNKSNYIFNLYYEHLKSTKICTHTIEIKLSSIYLLLKVIDDNDKSLISIERNFIYEFINKCIELGWSYDFQDCTKSNIKQFLNWTYTNNFSTISGDMVLPKIVWHRNTNIKSYYSKEEIINLLNVIDTNTNSGKEEFLIITIICYLGLRISDVVNLKLSNINFKNNTISIIQYKTDKLLTLPLINNVKYALLDYLKNVRPKDCELDDIFVTFDKPYRHKKELVRHSYIVKNNMLKAGININGRHTGFHCLRHSLSTILLSENVSLYAISDILGHQSINTTMTYLDIDFSKLKELALEVPDVK